METWQVLLAVLLIATLVVLLVWYAQRKDRRRERAEIEVPEDIFDAPAGRGGTATATGSVGGRGSRISDQDRNEGDAGDGGGGDGGGD
jgi:hypothetical protein